MSDPNIAEKYYGKLRSKGEETIADFVWNQALEIKQLQSTNQQLVEALELADAALSGSNMDMAHVEKKLKQALANAKPQTND